MIQQTFRQFELGYVIIFEGSRGRPYISVEKKVCSCESDRILNWIIRPEQQHAGARLTASQ